MTLSAKKLQGTRFHEDNMILHDAGWQAMPVQELATSNVEKFLQLPNQ